MRKQHKDEENPALEDIKSHDKEKKLHRIYNAFLPANASKTSRTVYFVLRLFVIVILISACIRGDFESVFYCALTLILFMLPIIIERSFSVDLPSTMEIIIVLFVFASEILGELQCYFVRVPHWDTMLHTINGFICAAVGFSLVDVFNRNKNIKFQLSPIYMAIVAFCFSMTIGVLWEFFEFGSDVFLHSDMQKDSVITAISSVTLDSTNSNIPIIISGINETAVNGKDLGINGYLDIGLIDTMKDLLVNFIGAVVFSVIGYFYVKSKGKNKFASRFIPVLADTPDPEQPTPSAKKHKNKDK